jgi:adenosylcobyric acid synthase
MNPKPLGSYIHGIFDNKVVINHILRHNAGVESNSNIDYKSFKEEQYNKLALHVRKHVYLEYIYKELENGQ